MLVQGHVAQALEAVGAIHLLGCNGGGPPVGRLANAYRGGVAPVNGLEGTHLLPGIENDVFSACTEDHDIVIELIEIQVPRLKYAALAIDHLHRKGTEAGGAQHGEIEKGNIVAAAGLLGP